MVGTLSRILLRLNIIKPRVRYELSATCLDRIRAIRRDFKFNPRQQGPEATCSMSRAKEENSGRLKYLRTVTISCASPRRSNYSIRHEFPIAYCDIRFRVRRHFHSRVQVLNISRGHRSPATVRSLPQCGTTADTSQRRQLADNGGKREFSNTADGVFISCGRSLISLTTHRRLRPASMLHTE